MFGGVKDPRRAETYVDRRFVDAPIQGIRAIRESTNRQGITGILSTCGKGNRLDGPVIDLNVDRVTGGVMPCNHGMPPIRSHSAAVYERRAADLEAKAGPGIPAAIPL